MFFAVEQKSREIASKSLKTYFFPLFFLSVCCVSLFLLLSDSTRIQLTQNMNTQKEVVGNSCENLYFCENGNFMSSEAEMCKFGLTDN